MKKLMRRAHLTSRLAAVFAGMTAPLAAFELYAGDYLSALSTAFVFMAFAFMYRSNGNLRDTAMQIDAIRQQAMTLGEPAFTNAVTVSAGPACPNCQATDEMSPCGVLLMVECGACHHQWPARQISNDGEPHRVH